MINFRKGNGSTLYGTGIMLLGFVLVILVVEYQDVFRAKISAQTTVDTVTDGVAAYAAREFGGYEQDDIEAKYAEMTAMIQNEPSEYKYEFEKQDLGDKNLLGIKVETEAKRTFQMSGESPEFDVTAKSKVALLSYYDPFQNEAFPNDYTKMINPPWLSVKRSKEAYLRAIDALDMVDNTRYTAVRTQKPEVLSSVFAWDLAVIMNCNIGFTGRTYYSNGTIQTPNEMYDSFKDSALTTEIIGGILVTVPSRVFRWKIVDVKDAFEQAQEGNMTIILHKQDEETEGHGIVYVVRPDGDEAHRDIDELFVCYFLENGTCETSTYYKVQENDCIYSYNPGLLEQLKTE